MKNRPGPTPEETKRKFREYADRTALPAAPKPPVTMDQWQLDSLAREIAEGSDAKQRHAKVVQGSRRANAGREAIIPVEVFDRMRAAGDTYAKIAEAHGYSVQAVSNWRKRNGR